MNEKDIIQKEILTPLINTIVLKEEPITQLVISGGAIWGFSAFGAICEAAEKGLFDMKNITAMYGTSVGAMVASVLAMKFDMDVYADYLIKRPWQKVWNIDITKVIGAYENSGIYSRDFMCKFIQPFLLARDLSIDINMLDFFKHTGVDLHIYVTEVNDFVCVDISHKTHPEWKLIDAVYASCCLPVVFSPHIIEDKCYIDGCFFSNYPIDYCINNIGEENKHRILGIYLLTYDVRNVQQKIQKTNMFDYLMQLMQKFLCHRVFSTFNNKMIDKSNILYDLTMPNGEITLEYCDALLNSRKEREECINKGKIIMSEFIHEKTKLLL